MRYSAVLFDLDGTLLDTLEDLADAVNRVMAARGFPQHPTAAFRYFVGDGSTKLIERVLPKERRSPATIGECLAQFKREYELNWNVKTRPYPGIAEMLDGLVERKVRLSVLSNKIDAFTRKCVEELLPRWKFEVILGQRDGISVKPDPGGALEVAKLMNLPPSQFLYLGDTSMDMQTALGAGMYPVGALWGFREREELETGGAESIIARPQELLALLSQF
jgi:phosphoglycolate phosphatase